MTRDIPIESAILDLEAWEAPDHLTSDDLYLEAGSDHRLGDHHLRDEREDDR